MSDDPRTILEAPLTIFETPVTIIEQPMTIRESAASDSVATGLSSFRDCRITESFSARGGEADIYLVERTGEQLLLKLYRLGMAPREEVLRQISDLGLRFPNQIVAIREYGFDDRSRRWYELMEYAAAGSLRELVAGGIGTELALQAAREIAQAITVLHRHNVLHLDLKPSNILVRSRDPLNLIFTDFGVSSIIDPELSRKLTTVKGTPHYWSPESITGVVGKEADYWALGIIILELLLGRHPFSGIDNKVIMYNLATKGIDIPEGLEPRFLPLLQGLLTREPRLRWGADQVQRWLKGDTDIPVQYHQAQGQPLAKCATPIRFMGHEFTTPRDLVGFLASDAGGWKEIVNYLESGQLEKWLSDCGDYDGSTRVHLIAETVREERELSILRLIYGFDPALPFVLYGKLITFGNLRRYLQNFLQRIGDEAEEAIADDLLKGTLLRLYREYLLQTKQEPDRLAVILETVSKMVSFSEYDYDYDDELLQVASFFEALDDPAPWLLPTGWPGNLEERVAETARGMRYLLRRERYEEILGEYAIPAELSDAIAKALGSTAGEQLFKLTRLLLEHIDKKQLLQQQELDELTAKFLPPAGMEQAIRASKFETAVKAVGVLRSLQAEGLLIPRDGLEAFLERNAGTLRLSLIDDRLVSNSSRKDIPLSEYQLVARYVRNSIPTYMLPKLDAIQVAFESAAETDLQARRAPLFLYLEALRSLRIKWDQSDNGAVKDIWEQLFNRKTPATGLLGVVDDRQADRWEVWLEHFMMRSFDPATQEKEWAMRGALFGALIGLAVWLVISTGAISAADQAEGNIFKVLIGMAVAMSIYRTWLPQLIIVASSFTLWRIGGGWCAGILLYAVIGSNLMATLGVWMGRTRPSDTPRGDSIYQLHQTRIDDVILQYEESSNGR